MESPTFKVSPFDKLITDLNQSTLGNPAYGKLMPLGSKVLHHIRILRVAYISYSRTITTSPKNAKSGATKMTTQEMIESQDKGIKVSLDYYQLVSLINQLGDVLKKEKHIPSYYEINFFRNKVSEHWNGYLTTKPAGSGMQKVGRLPIPILCNNHSTALAESSRLRLIKEIANCAKKSLDTDLLDNLWYEDYAKKIFPLLKEIDPELKREPKKKKGKFIPDTLVKLLFDYEFPLPFYDVENYCKGLANYFEKLDLTKK